MNLGKFPGDGEGNKEAWYAAVHGVTKKQTQLKRLNNKNTHKIHIAIYKPHGNQKSKSVIDTHTQKEI